VATDLRGGGGFNSGFLRRSFLNLTVKIMKIGPRLPIHVCYYYYYYYYKSSQK